MPNTFSSQPRTPQIPSHQQRLEAMRAGRKARSKAFRKLLGVSNKKPARSSTAPGLESKPQT